MPYNLTKKNQVRGSKEKKKKLPSIGNLIKKVDKACSVAILKIDELKPWDNPPCDGFICNNHLIRRGMHKVRFHPLNCFAGTSGANYRHEQNNHYMVAWYLENYGERVYRELQKYSVGEAKWTRDELNSILAFYTQIGECDGIPNRQWVIEKYMYCFRPNDQDDLCRAFSARFGESYGEL